MTGDTDVDGEQARRTKDLSTKLCSSLAEASYGKDPCFAHQPPQFGERSSYCSTRIFVPAFETLNFPSRSTTCVIVLSKFAPTTGVTFGIISVGCVIGDAGSAWEVS